MSFTLAPVPEDVIAQCLCVWIAGGAWHAVCRLVCRTWTRCLAGRAYRRCPWSPWCEIARARSPALAAWARALHIPYTTRVLVILAADGEWQSIGWLLRRDAEANLLAISGMQRRAIAVQTVRSGPAGLDRYATEDADVRAVAL